MDKAEVRDLTEEERAVLELVIRKGLTVGIQEALSQLAVARHGGGTHGFDVCFDIWVPMNVELIPDGNVTPIEIEERPHDQIVMGEVLLWLKNGRLSYLELAEVSEPDMHVANTRWPALSELILPAEA